MHAKLLQLFPTLCNPVNCTYQSPRSMGHWKQNYWSGLSCPLPGGHPDPGIKPTSLMSPVLAGRSFTTSATWEAIFRLKKQNPSAINHDSVLKCLYLQNT